MADIRNVRMMKTSAQIVRLPTDDPFLAYDLDSQAEVEYEPGAQSFVVRSIHRLAIMSGGSADEPHTPDTATSVANIECEHAALFVLSLSEGDAPPTADELTAYAVSTGQFALYPYVREYIYNVTGRLGLPPLTLGVLKAPIDPSWLARPEDSPEHR
jgi:hypothetical protein